jgi:hypothetical protein
MSILQLYQQTLILFIASLIVQSLVWRTLCRPDGVVPFQIIILFALFWGVPLAYFGYQPSFDQLVLSLALGSCYIMSFPAAAAKSPTVMILWLLKKSGGLTKAELESALSKELDLKGDRMKDLQADGLYTAGGRPSLSGRVLGYAFFSYRKILGIPLGEG